MDRKEYRELAKKVGCCTSCFKEKCWQGRTMCPKCLDKNKESSERTRSETSKEQRRRYVKRKRDLCVAYSICRECMCKKATVKLKCIECHVKELKRRDKNRKGVKRNMRAELGLCYFCGEFAINGKKTCSKHFKIQGDKFKKWHNENRDNSNHIWRKIQSGEVKNIQHYKNQINSQCNEKMMFK